MAERLLPQDRPPPKTATEARAGRVVRGGAIQRTLLVSVSLAILALLTVFLLMR
jgi:hypothetical protein